MTSEYIIPVMLACVGSIAIFSCIMMWRLERKDERKKYGNYNYRTRDHHADNTTVAKVPPDKPTSKGS